MTGTPGCYVEARKAIETAAEALEALQTVRNHAESITVTALQGAYGELPAELLEAFEMLQDRINRLVIS